MSGENFAWKISFIYRHGRVIYDRALKDLEISGHQVGYLISIYKEPGISQEELARKMRIDKGAVAKAMKELRKKDLINRKQSRDDKRIYGLFLTERAVDICVRGAEFEKRMEAALTKGLTADEADELGRLLGKVADNMENITEGRIEL